MSGHSKWSTIKRQKGATDAKRGMTFTKISKNITLAAKQGNSGDPGTNPRLRLALEQAREANMPKDNIQRAIDRGLGKLPGQTIEEVVYEGFGPGRVAFIAEGLTDNRLRTNQEIKNMFDRSGGSFGGTAYMFDKVGEIKVESKGGESDEEILEIIDFGAEDVEEYEDEGMQRYLVYVSTAALSEMSNKITQKGYTIEVAEMVQKPNMTVEIADVETAKKVIEFTQKLEDHDDIQKVHANFDIPDAIMEQL